MTTYLSGWLVRGMLLLRWSLLQPQFPIVGERSSALTALANRFFENLFF
jgi:hypothetical protein